MTDNFKNILIIKPSALGDIILALPALSALRRNYPDAKISWLIRAEYAPLIENHPDLDQVILFDRKFLGKAWYNPKAFAAIISLIKQLQENSFDVIFDFQGLLRTACFSWLSGCKNRFGMANAREFSRIFYTHKIKQDEDCIHLVDYYLKIIKTSGVSDINVQFVLPHNSDVEVAVKKIIESNNVDSNEYVVFVPCSAHTDKCWPLERFAALADKITNDFKLQVVATGAAGESDIIEKLKLLSNVQITNLAGKLNLKELTALLRAARLVVSNDTGPGHIAAALGTPLVMMFGWSNPVRIAPYGRAESLLAAGMENRGIRIKSYDPAHSVEAITFEQVYKKVSEQLNKTLNK